MSDRGAQVPHQPSPLRRAVGTLRLSRRQVQQITDAPSESINHSYGWADRQLPIPGFIHATLTRLNVWQDRALKRVAARRSDLQPHEVSEHLLVSKAEEYIGGQAKVGYLPPRCRFFHVPRS